MLDDLLTNKHRTPFLILDEAHLLPDSVEQLRLLFSTQMDSQSLGALLLVGQPELRRTLRLANHEVFYQRLTTTYHLPPLDLTQSMAYIRHQITFSGYKGGSLFADDTLARIYDYTKGIPRQMNRLCTTALLVGMADQKQILEESGHPQSHCRTRPGVTRQTTKNGLLSGPIFYAHFVIIYSGLAPPFISDANKPSNFYRVSTQSRI